MAEHAVIVHLKLRNGSFGATEERKTIHSLCDEIAKAIEENDVGEFDGDEFGEGTCTLYMYGPDADALFAVTEPLLRASTASPGGHAIKRSGEAGDPSAKEVRVDL